MHERLPSAGWRRPGLLLLILAFALYALAIYVARGRRRLLLGATGASLVFVGLLIALLLRFLSPVVVDSLVKVDANKDLVSSILVIETAVLRDIAVLLVVYGALVLIATAIGGTSGPATAIRRWLAPSFAHHPVVVWAVAVLVFLVLLAWGPRAGNRELVGVAIVAVTAAIAIETLRRQTLREYGYSEGRGARAEPQVAQHH